MSVITCESFNKRYAEIKEGKAKLDSLVVFQVNSLKTDKQTGTTVIPLKFVDENKGSHAPFAVAKLEALMNAPARKQAPPMLSVAKYKDESHTVESEFYKFAANIDEILREQAPKLAKELKIDMTEPIFSNTVTKYSMKRDDANAGIDLPNPVARSWLATDFEDRKQLKVVVCNSKLKPTKATPKTINKLVPIEQLVNFDAKVSGLRYTKKGVSMNLSTHDIIVREETAGHNIDPKMLL